MPWLPECVRSVAEQQGDFTVEHLVLDGGSTDGSREWLEQNRSLGYESVFEPDRGQTDALIKGFSRASGSIFGWLNADDALLPGALQKVVAVFRARPQIALVSGACQCVDAEGRLIGGFPALAETTFSGFIRHSVFPPQPAAFFSAAAYRSCGGLDSRYDLAMDLDLWLRLARVGEIAALPGENLARYRMHPAAKTETRSGASVRESFRVRRRHGMPLLSPASRYLIRRGYLSPVIAPLRRLVRRLGSRH